MDLSSVLISQYLASLEMFKQAVILCPEPIWNAAGDRTKFWHLAYHALFFTHVYLEDSEDNFTFWAGHREGYEDFDPPPQGAPYEKADILEYLAFCQQRVEQAVPRMSLEAPTRHGGKSFSTLELQIYSIRHIMQHTGALMERLSSLEEQINWVGSRRR
jgi:hypothetical protein